MGTSLEGAHSIAPKLSAIIDFQLTLLVFHALFLNFLTGTPKKAVDMAMHLLKPPERE